MSNQWFRMYAEFANDPKVQMLQENMQRRLVMLFCFRCNGDVTLHDEEIAFQLRISGDDWQHTKQLFVAKGFIDTANNLMNWDKRQYKSDSSAERVRRHREKQCNTDVTACNVTVTPPEQIQIQNRTDTEQKEEVGRDLQEIASPAPKKAKATRLSPDWDLPTDWGEWALAQGLTESEVLAECDKFKDFWIAKAGPNATKANWEATWRNWIRKRLEGFGK